MEDNLKKSKTPGRDDKDQQGCCSAGTSGKQDQGQPIEVPGRPDADRERDRDKAYGPGGGRAVNQADEVAPQTGVDDPRTVPGQAVPPRTGQGADTNPM